MVDGDKLVKDDLDERPHDCITTFEGLDEYYDIFAKLLSKENNMTYDEAYRLVENKKYDYEIMDKAFGLLINLGYYFKRI